MQPETSGANRYRALSRGTQFNPMEPDVSSPWELIARRSPLPTHGKGREWGNPSCHLTQKNSYPASVFDHGMRTSLRSAPVGLLGVLVPLGPAPVWTNVAYSLHASHYLSRLWQHVFFPHCSCASPLSCACLNAGPGASAWPQKKQNVMLSVCVDVSLADVFFEYTDFTLWPSFQILWC